MKNKITTLAIVLTAIPTIVMAQSVPRQFTLECTIDKTTASGLFTNGKKAEPLDYVGDISITNIDLDKKLYCDEDCMEDYNIVSINGSIVTLEQNEFYNDDPEDIYDKTFILNTANLTTHVYGSNYDKAGKNKVGTYDFTEKCKVIPFEGLSDVF